MGALRQHVDPISLIPLQPRDYLTLFTLVSEERHGYGIAKQIEKDSNGQVRVDQANLYRSLKRLKSIGLLEDAEDREDTDDRRRYYRLTTLGQKVARLEAARLARLTAQARSLELIPGAGD